MKPIIGIVMRPEVNKNQRDIFGLYKEVSEAIYAFGGNVVAIVPPHLGTLSEMEKQNLYQIIDICDGILFEGGVDFYDYDMVICKYVHDHDIPTLGICLGMQIMGVFGGGNMLDFETKFHNQPGSCYVHAIDIAKDSLLYSILGQDKIWVNSRHNSYIDTTSFLVSASYDGVIEALEDPTQKFFIGVQYHPEDMITYDTVEKRLFQSFINACKR